MPVLWIPLTILAAFCQNLRTVLQKRLTATLSTAGSNATRFVFGFPFAILYVLMLRYGFGQSWPDPNAAFLLWMAVGGLAQILATGLLLMALAYRNFPVGVAYSKTEVVQAAVFGLIFLGDTISALGVAAIAIGTAGVMLISLTRSTHLARDLLLGWTEKPALFGLASGALFAISGVAYRAASLSLGHDSFLMAAGYTLAWTTAFQSAVMLAWLKLREPGQFARMVGQWRVAVLVGIASAIGSAGWFTAMTIQTVAYVRTLGLIELVFTFLAARLVFGERSPATEVIGVILIVIGIALALNLR
jgi:drug/metabolite transporter (DMT)-like permease